MYDLNGDGVITKDEMEDVTASVFTEFEILNQIQSTRPLEMKNKTVLQKI